MFFQSRDDVLVYSGLVCSSCEMVSECVDFNFWVYGFGCRGIPFYLLDLSPDLCCVDFSKLVAPFVPLLLLEVEELPFGCFWTETKHSSVSFGWVGLDNFSELAYLFRPFSSTSKLGGLWS